MKTYNIDLSWSTTQETPYFFFFSFGRGSSIESVSDKIYNSQVLNLNHVTCKTEDDGEKEYTPTRYILPPLTQM